MTINNMQTWSWNVGWKCPGCSACYAPSVPQCWNCRGTQVVVTDTTGAPSGGWGWAHAGPCQPGCTCMAAKLRTPPTE